MRINIGRLINSIPKELIPIRLGSQAVGYVLISIRHANQMDGKFDGWLLTQKK